MIPVDIFRLQKSDREAEGGILTSSMARNPHWSLILTSDPWCLILGGWSLTDAPSPLAVRSPLMLEQPASNSTPSQTRWTQVNQTQPKSNQVDDVEARTFPESLNCNSSHAGFLHWHRSLAATRIFIRQYVGKDSTWKARSDQTNWDLYTHSFLGLS